MTSLSGEITDQRISEEPEVAELLVGPLLRYVGTETATIWVETTRACEVAILGQRTRTFSVEGHYYALVMIMDLEPGTTTPYDIRLDDVVVWPRTDDERPPPSIRTRHNQPEVRLVFG